MQSIKKNIFSCLAGIFLSLLAIFGGLTLSGCSSEKEKQENYNPSKIVLMIGDGMSENHILCASNYLEKDQTLNMTQLLYSGKVDTSSLSTIDYHKATDSAAAATAIATGTRVYNDYVSMDKEGNNLKTIAEIAHEKGWGVGIVTTDSLDEGTPAAFSSHAPNRYDFDKIRQDQYSSDFDLFLGADHYQTKLEITSQGYYKQNKTLEDGQGISGYTYALEQEKITDAGYTFFDDFKELNLQSDKIFAAFPATSTTRLKAPQDNNFSNKAPSLSQMTEFAVEYMETKFPDGYFLMIEDNDIDVMSETWSDHYETGLMAECVLEFDRSVGYAKKQLDTSEKDYTLIVTADHATGSLVRESTGENLYSFWSHQHNDWNVPYFIEAKNCTLNQEILNTDLFVYMNNILSQNTNQE